MPHMSNLNWLMTFIFLFLMMMVFFTFLKPMKTLKNI